MKIVVTMPVRSEDWCLGLTARAVLKWADELVILDHASTDKSLDIAIQVEHEHPGRVSVIAEQNSRWEEMRHRHRLLELARDRGATHVAIVDADEILSSNLLPSIRNLIEKTPKGSILQIPWLAMRGSVGQVHIAGPWSDGQNVSTAFVDSPELHWSSAARGGYDFHHRHPMGSSLVPFMPLKDRNAGLMHLQFISGRRLRAKQYLYQLTETLRWPGRETPHVIRQRYSLSVYGNCEPHAGWEARMDKTLAEAPVKLWWEAYEPLMQHFKPHTVPWQEAECLRLLEAHGPKRFDGLDSFGIGEIEAFKRA